MTSKIQPCYSNLYLNIPVIPLSFWNRLYIPYITSPFLLFLSWPHHTYISLHHQCSSHTSYLVITFLHFHSYCSVYNTFFSPGWLPSMYSSFKAQFKALALLRDLSWLHLLQDWVEYTFPLISTMPHTYFSIVHIKSLLVYTLWYKPVTARIHPAYLHLCI